MCAHWHMSHMLSVCHPLEEHVCHSTQAPDGRRTSSRFTGGILPYTAVGYAAAVFVSCFSVGTMDGELSVGKAPVTNALGVTKAPGSYKRIADIADPEEREWQRKKARKSAEAAGGVFVSREAWEALQTKVKALEAGGVHVHASRETKAKALEAAGVHVHVHVHY